MSDEKAEHDDIWGAIKIQSTEKVREGEENQSRNGIGYGVAEPLVYSASPLAYVEFPVRDWLAGLHDEVDDGEQEAENHQAEVHPEADWVIGCIRE